MKSKGFLNKYDILKPFTGWRTAIEYNNKLWIYYIGKVIHTSHEYKISIYIFFIWKYKQDYITIRLVLHIEWSTLSFGYLFDWRWFCSEISSYIIDGNLNDLLIISCNNNMSFHSFELRKMSSHYNKKMHESNICCTCCDGFSITAEYVFRSIWYLYNIYTTVFWVNRLNNPTRNVIQSNYC